MSPLLNPESWFIDWKTAMKWRGVGDPVSAVIGGLGAAGNIIGGLIGSSSAKKAAQIQAQNAQRVAQMGTDAATRGEQLVDTATGDAVNRVNEGVSSANRSLTDFYQEQAQKYQPYIDLGNQGAKQLASATAPGGSLTGQFSFNPSDVVNSPEYQFNLQQGIEALKRSAAATGGLMSGGAQKSALSYGEGLASNSYQQAYNNALTGFNTNRNATLQNIQSLLQPGMYGTSGFTQASQNAGNQIAGNTMQGAQFGANIPLQSAMYNSGLGVQAAQIAGNALTGGANASAAGTIGSGNAWNNALGGLTNTAQYFALLNKLPIPQQQSNPNVMYGSYGSTGPSGFSYSPYNPGGTPMSDADLMPLNSGMPSNGSSFFLQ
jgi:hypothetical protein